MPYLMSTMLKLESCSTVLAAVVLQKGSRLRDCVARVGLVSHCRFFVHCSCIALALQRWLKHLKPIALPRTCSMDWSRRGYKLDLVLRYVMTLPNQCWKSRPVASAVGCCVICRCLNCLTPLKTWVHCVFVPVCICLYCVSLCVYNVWISPMNTRFCQCTNTLLL